MAKEKTQKLLSNVGGSLDEDDISGADSDVDPAWIPNNDENDVSRNISSVLNRRRFNHKKFSKNGHSPSTSSSINCNNNNNTNNNNNHLDDSSTGVPFKVFIYLLN